ncbi:hypothetical protein C8Q78DRAFT_85597 [Trametes maxima]|nr:hypothetical protein C8Q78DRAFT_85597 [Trametes maxima]
MRSSWRVGFVCFFALVTWIQLVCAVPAEKDTSTASASLTLTTRPSPPSSTSNAAQTRPTAPRAGALGSNDATQTGLTDRQSTTQSAHTTTSHSIIIPPTQHRSHPHPSWSASPGQPFSIHHFPPPPGQTPQPRPHPPPSSQAGQPPIAIAFEVLGGVIGLAILAGLARCYIVWRRTPPRDRIAALVSRHQLEREMEEMERERMERLNQALEARRWRPPPPPYQQAPEYEAVVNTEPPAS